MSHELEPLLPDNDRPRDESDLITQDWVVEGLVVDTDGGMPRYVVTKVISGHDNLYPGNHWFHELNSLHSNYILSPENIMDSYYREVYGNARYEKVEDKPYGLDTLSAPQYEATVGDRIRVARWSEKIPYLYDVKTREANGWHIEHIDTVSVLETGVDIAKEQDEVLRRKKYIRKNLAGILRRLERMQLDKHERLETDVEASIGWKRWRYDDGTHVDVAEFIYGDGAIEDHFVRLKAERYVPYDDVPLSGDLRLTQSGRGFVGRDIIAGAPSKELALIDEPLMLLTARVWTQTAYNPDVGDMRVCFVIDGVQYTGAIDVELSSRSFSSPGHHLEFNEFTSPGDGEDAIMLEQEELDAIFKYKDTVSKLELTAWRAGINVRRTKKELSTVSSTELERVRPLLDEIEVVRKQAFQELQPILDGMNARPADSKLFGVKLLVPKSKLENVRVMVTIQDSSKN